MSGTAVVFHLQRELSQISQEQKELLEKLQEEVEQKEQLRKLKNEMESERRHLDKTIEKLQKEVRGQEAEPRAGRPRRTQHLLPQRLRKSIVPPGTDVSGRCRYPAAIPWSLEIPDARNLAKT